MPVFGYNLCKLYTDGNQNNITYKITTLGGLTGPAIRMQSESVIVGLNSSLLISNDGAEAATNLYIDRYTVPPVLVSALTGNKAVSQFFGGSQWQDVANGDTATGYGTSGAPLVSQAYYNKEGSGGSLDLAKNNFSQTAFPSAARTATTTSSTLYNRNGSGIFYILDITAVGGGGDTITPRVQGIDSISDNVYDIEIGSSRSGTGTFPSCVYPAVTDTDGQLVSKQDTPIPREYVIKVSASASSSFTYSISVVTIL